MIYGILKLNIYEQDAHWLFRHTLTLLYTWSITPNRANSVMEHFVFSHGSVFEYTLFYRSPVFRLRDDRSWLSVQFSESNQKIVQAKTINRCHTTTITSWKQTPSMSVATKCRLDKSSPFLRLWDKYHRYFLAREEQIFNVKARHAEVLPRYC